MNEEEKDRLNAIEKETMILREEVNNGLKKIVFTRPYVLASDLEWLIEKAKIALNKE